jgi:hypothetical protein
MGYENDLRGAGQPIHTCRRWHRTSVIFHAGTEMRLYQVALI